MMKATGVAIFSLYGLEVQKKNPPLWIFCQQTLVDSIRSTRDDEFNRAQFEKSFYMPENENILRLDDPTDLVRQFTYYTIKISGNSERQVR